MIGIPVNDHACLGAITEVVAQLVEDGDEQLVEIAAQHPTTDSLQGWFRSLPQRDDLGAPDDVPKVEGCNPPQRLRFGASDPNCVERAATYLGVAELIDPQPVRQLATLDMTPIGMHTFPVENGAPVILDPRVTRDCLECGLALISDEPVTIAPIEAIEWTTQLAGAGAVPLRNGPDRVRVARDAIYRLVDQGIAPAAREIDLIGWLLSLAERVARRYGPRALAIVRSTAQAIIDLVDTATARTQDAVTAPTQDSAPIRNLPFVAAIWTSALASIASKVAAQVGDTAVKAITKQISASGKPRKPRPIVSASTS